ncbi:CAP-Gly domain-containing linker protein 2 isoform X1 [Epinephelus fuscoguttatus]|uniref:CAP-Gly domain-containing linker protein 2 isoform X1 n=1 Tax=Epinephelus fuscoguttatus TaxID=293821 RepID=UPI0020D039FE|nr:CAP-Gly domain-containing linker protein 2 isoform X1 [Epinephelus fuscoguttatus]XP_049438987.1 CAP-Gly domain-containing linker protein 2 isoform X1 [Epinephelus fuscoguttatus]
MTSYILWTAFTWTFKGILCTCRFLWICPYNAIKFLPRERHVTEDTSRQLKQLVGSESKAIPAIPGSPDRTTALHKRLTKTEKEILSLKTRVACERASWERRFGELQRKQEELCNQLASQAGVLVNVGGGDEQGEAGVDNGEAYEECSGGLSIVMYQHRESEVSSRSDTYASSLSSRPSSSSSSSATSVRSWRMSKGPHRVFVPHSPMDLELGHRVRIMLPSGRISTGTIRFLGHLQGEADLHLGVELQTPDHGLHDGSHRGHSYFECKPGYGAFVPFHKLLMAWE